MAGIYIHVPFCRQACHYCNFYFSTSTANKARFVEALLKEIELSKDYLQGEAIETIYFGGGTPSVLTGDELNLIMDTLSRFYNLNHIQEFTFEANPDDLSNEAIQTFKQAGVNRFSIGVQSFFDEDLQYMNRAHNAIDAISSIKRAQDAGFNSLTIDLIYGVPTLTDEKWQKNLDTAFSLGIPHLSCYALTVEPKTSLERKIAKGQYAKVDDAQSARQFTMLMDEVKKAGYEHYEISNFSKPGKYAVHNTNYWLGKKYLGLGPSAHSFNTKSRRWNVANNVNYINSLHSGLIPFEEETLTETQQVNEYIMTSLRTMWGLDLAKHPKYRLAIINALEAVETDTYVLDNNIICLTDKGRLFADAIAAELFVEI